MNVQNSLAQQDAMVKTQTANLIIIGQVLYHLLIANLTDAPQKFVQSWLSIVEVPGQVRC